MRAPRAWLTLWLLTVICASIPGAARADASPLVVDQNSIGGACSDSRTPAQVSVTTPWCTIVQAVKSAPSGSTVLVRAGDYPYELLHGLGTRSDYVTFEPYGYGGSSPEAVTIAGVSTANTSFLRFQGFHFIGTDVGGFVAGIRIYTNSQQIQFIDNDVTGEGIQLQTASHVLLQGNYVHDVVRTCSVGSPDGFGMYITGGTAPATADDVQILDNRIEGNPQDALNMGNLTNVLVEGNDISTGTPQCGDHMDLIQIEGTGKGPFTIRGNVFHDGSQFILRNAAGLTFENNLVLRVDAWMQLMADPGARIVNNTWWGGNTVCTGCGSILIRDWAPGSSWTQPPFNYSSQMDGTVVENNILHRLGIDSVPATQYQEDYNVITDLVRSNSSGIQGLHTIFAVPTFADYTAGDLALAPGSVGIDSADSVVAPATDMFGQERWDDPDVLNTGGGSLDYVDAGAVERQPAGTPVPPPPAGGDPPPADGGGGDGGGAPPGDSGPPDPSLPAPPVSSPPADPAGPARRSEPPALRLLTGRPRVAHHARSFSLGLRCSERCRVTVTGSLTPSRISARRRAHNAKALHLRRSSVGLRAGKRRRVVIRLPSRLPVLYHGRAVVTLRISASTQSGGSATKTLRFNLKIAGGPNAAR